jgi:transcriptional regulator with XRE-family HTH domain
MKMFIDRDLLRRKIMNDPEMEADAGFPVAALEGLGMFLPPELTPANDDETVRLKEAFGVFVRQLRRRDNMSVEDLCQMARVEEAELREIEHNPHHKPRPRTVHQLASIFRVPERAFMKLSGATVTNDNQFHEEASRFAAKSDDMAKLTSAERKALNEYISFLSKHNGD